jgi:hypothetical protein
MDTETWRFINTFAPWLSALGALAAVITALYLARRSERISLKLSLGIRKVAVEGGTFGDSPSLVWAGITNVGRRTATLTTLWFRPHLWGKAGVVWLAPRNAFSSPFPITLGDGQSANYASPVEEFRKNFEDIAHDWVSKKLGRLRLRFLSFRVTTSAGQTFSAIPEKPIRQLLLDMACRPKSTATDSAQPAAALRRGKPRA